MPPLTAAKPHLLLAAPRFPVPPPSAYFPGSNVRADHLQPKLQSLSPQTCNVTDRTKRKSKSSYPVFHISLQYVMEEKSKQATGCMGTLSKATDSARLGRGPRLPTALDSPRLSLGEAA